ncbi:MAG: hypothetical protein FWH39_01605 [Bacteroidales bacterium]|nr:hypothetical protein [Bacteroidales bacterium]
MNNIAELLRKIVLSDESPQILICTVDKVNGAFCDVSPVDKNIAPLTNVRLNAYSETPDFLIKPKEESYVLVAKINHSDAYVAMFSEIDTVRIRNEHYSLCKAFNMLLDAIMNLKVTTGTGPSGVPINLSEFNTIKTKINQLLEE